MRLYKFNILLIILAETFFSGNAFSQTLVNKGQTITISLNAKISVAGTLANEGIINNQGILLIHGDWLNNNKYNGRGTVVFNSDQPQIIDHNNNEFYNLVIDGKGEKRLTSDASISGELYLKNGILTPEDSSLLLLKKQAIVSGGNSKSFVSGRLFHEGTGKKYYPIGKNGSFKPVALEVVGDDPVVGFELFEPNPDPYFYLNIRAVSSARYWEKTLLSGRLDSTSVITLPVGNDHLNGEIDLLVIAGLEKEDSNYRVIGEPYISGFMSNGTISSPLSFGSDYFALALLAKHPEERSLYVPNAFAPFSPKANNEDKVIKVYGREISPDDFFFRIFNRWGEVMYETTSYEEASQTGWNGIAETTGREQSFGIYQYILKGKFNSGKPIDQMGSINLIK